MDTLDTIFTRRSIRKFNNKAILAEQVETILKAAMSAPSAGNAQPWHFVVVDDPKILSKIAELHPHAKMAAHAPLGIFVCVDPALEKYPGFWPQDCSAATQNILLAARALGLGSVWTGIYPHLDPTPFCNLINMPETIIPMAFIVIGHSDVEPKEAERYNPARVHHNQW